MKIFPRAAVFALLALLSAARADMLLVPPVGRVIAGKEVRLALYLNNPTTEATTVVFPGEISAQFATDRERRTLELRPVRPLREDAVPLPAMRFRRVEFAVTIPDTAEGVVSLRVTEPATNVVMFVVEGAHTVSLAPENVRAAQAAAEEQPRSLSLDTDRETMRRHISVHEPIYFALGGEDGLNAKFQISFRYRILGDEAHDRRWWENLYFGYTQTSLWDLHSLSKPFYDTSYKPTLFYFRPVVRSWRGARTRLGVLGGAQHESNGKGGGDSRSINTVYLAPLLALGDPLGWTLKFSPRAIAYVERAENPDIARYRGNVDYVVRVGTDVGWQFTATLRKGNGTGYGSAQLDVTLPLRLVPGASETAGGYLYGQYFNGWGESILDYNRRRPAQLRLGYQLVR